VKRTKRLTRAIRTCSVSTIRWKGAQLNRGHNIEKLGGSTCALLGFGGRKKEDGKMHILGGLARNLEAKQGKVWTGDFYRKNKERNL